MSLSLISPRLFDPLVRSAGRDPDVEQASLRVIVCVVAFAYVCYLIFSTGGISPGLGLGLVASTSDAIIGIAMIAMLRHGIGRGPNMRYLGIVADNTALTLGIAGAGEGGVAMIGVYLWVTIGNGFRFGARYLLASYWFSIAGLAALCTFAPFWLQHRAVGAGLLLALAIVPLYVLVLLSRLQAQKDAAEQLSNAKSRFVANVSHELRTPLTGITAVYDLLRGRKLQPDDSELVGMLGNALKTLKSSVDAVLQMSKLEAGAERAMKVPFNLSYFLQLLSEIVKPQSAVKHVAWRMDIDSAVMQTVVGDPSHLSHILGNLLNNAFKFTSRGSVTLRVRAGIPGRIKFEVIDTGIGIPPEKQEHLFERFVQADNSATRRYGGTGLGTSIARDLAELMGGSIGVISEAGKGSTFWVELPLPEYRDASWTIPDSETRREVLLVAGHEVTSVTSGLMRELGEIGFSPTLVAHDSPEAQFDAQKYFAAFIVMRADEAAHAAAKSMHRNGGITCPWLVVTDQCSGSQIATLASLGASAVMTSTSYVATLRSTLAGLANRIDVPGSEGAVANVERTVSKRAFNVLIADDNKSIQLLLTKILEGAEHAVQTAERGDEAFDIMAGGAIDVAIIDLNMPEMSGPDVVKLFRASSVGAPKLPIIVLSADATPAAREESLLAGADAFLTKPVSSSLLLSTIDKLVSGKSVRVTKEDDQASRIIEQPVFAKVECQPSNLVDFDRINAVKEIARSDSAFLDKYLTAAFSEVNIGIEQLRQAIIEQNVRAARDALHIIEGTAASVGAAGVVANCRRIRERLIGTDTEWDFQAVLAELSTSYALSKSTILAAVDRAPQPLRNRLPQRHG